MVWTELSCGCKSSPNQMVSQHWWFVSFLGYPLAPRGFEPYPECGCVRMDVKGGWCWGYWFLRDTFVSTIDCGCILRYSNYCNYPLAIYQPSQTVVNQHEPSLKSWFPSQTTSIHHDICALTTLNAWQVSSGAHKAIESSSWSAEKDQSSSQ